MLPAAPAPSPSDRRAGTAFGPVRTVQIFYRHLSLRRKDLILQLFGELALLLDTGDDLFLFFFQISQIDQALMQLPELFVIERSRHFFSVS